MTNIDRPILVDSGIQLAMRDIVDRLPGIANALLPGQLPGHQLVAVFAALGGKAAFTFGDLQLGRPEIVYVEDWPPASAAAGTLREIVRNRALPRSLEAIDPTASLQGRAIRMSLYAGGPDGVG